MTVVSGISGVPDHALTVFLIGVKQGNGIDSGIRHVDHDLQQGAEMAAHLLDEDGIVIIGIVDQDARVACRVMVFAQQDIEVVFAIAQMGVDDLHRDGAGAEARGRLFFNNEEDIEQCRSAHVFSRIDF